jgi:hypothetical protein
MVGAIGNASHFLNVYTNYLVVRTTTVRIAVIITGDALVKLTYLDLSRLCSV